MATRTPSNPPTVGELSCLNGWPEGTVGYRNDELLIMEVVQLCRQHGYGRVAQMVEGVHEIWRDPAAAEKWKAFRRERMSLPARPTDTEGGADDGRREARPGQEEVDRRQPD